MAPISRNTWDNVVIITRDANGDVVWDGGVKNLVYDSATLTWIAQAAASTVGAGDASAANQVTEIAKLTSIDGKLPALVSSRVPVDGSGVTQPVSGTVTANAGTGTFTVSGTVTANAGTGTMAVSASSLPLPTGASTETTLAAASAKLPATLGQKAMSASMAVAIASDQSTINTTVADATGSGSITTQNLNPSSGTATTNSTVAVSSLGGVMTAAIHITGTYTGTLTPQVTVDNSNWTALPNIRNITTGVITSTITSASVGIWQVDLAGATAFRMTATTAVTGTAVVTIRVSSGQSMVQLQGPIPAGSAIIGALTANQTVNLNTVAGTGIVTGNGVTGAGSIRVTLASDTSSNTNPLLFNQQNPTTSAVTSVAASATSVSLLASNTARRGAMFYNDSTVNLYLKLGATASTTSFTVLIAAGGYFELPNSRVYTGAIDGIWASATGSARITELS